MLGKPVFNKILQVGLVVRDVDEAVRTYWDDFGIGPWAIYIMDETATHSVRVNGKEAKIAMKIALADVGGVQLELIEPLNETNIYAEHLAAHGNGLHHIAVAVDDYDEAVARVREKGVAPIQDGVTKDGMGFAYLGTDKALSCITEIYKIPKDLQFGPPDRTYP